MQLTKILPRSRQAKELSPWGRDSFAALQSHINELFEELPTGFGLPLMEAPRTAARMRPRVDVTETPEAFVIEAEMPGVTKDDIEVSLPNPSTLVLSGEKKLEERKETDGNVFVERVFGTFYRAMTLGADIDADRVKAKLEDGVLKVTCPKAAPTVDSARKIEIES